MALAAVHLGDVASAASPHLFTIDDDAWFQFNDLPVIVRRPTGRAAFLDAGQFITVIGTVRPFIRAELERDYDWFDVDPEVSVELEGRPVIVADIARTSAGAVVAEPNRPVTHVLVADAGDIADLPGRFYGHIVSVNAEVEDVWSERTFTLDEDEWSTGVDVAVFNPAPIANERELFDLGDEDVRVVGVVRPFLAAEFEEDYDWFDVDAYDPRELEELERRPVIVASSVREDAREFVRFRPELALDAVEARVASRAQRWPETLARAASQRLAQPREGARATQEGSS